jgi:hypothetical protein
MLSMVEQALSGGEARAMELALGSWYAGEGVECDDGWGRIEVAMP